MKATRFSGPLLYSNQYPPFEGFPVSINPDYYSFIDDFDGKIVDTTNYWTFDSNNNGTLAVADSDGVSGAPNDNLVNGFAEIKSESVDPLTLNSGGTMNSFITCQPYIRGQAVLFETRLGVNNPKNCDLFAGIVPSATIAAGNFSITSNTNKAGFRLLSSEGTGKLECINGGVVQSDSNITDFDMPNLHPIRLSSSTGENGNTGPLDEYTTPILGILVSHQTARRAGTPIRVVIKYFINRKLVHTSVSTDDNVVLSNTNNSIVFGYNKITNRSGLTIQTDIDAVDENKIIFVDVPGSSINNGCGFPANTFFKVGTEFFKVLRTFPGDRVGSSHRMLVDRAQLGSTATTHSSGDSITEDSGSCFIDYSAISFNRYPVYSDAPTANSQYLVDGNKSR